MLRPHDDGEAVARLDAERAWEAFARRERERDLAGDAVSNSARVVVDTISGLVAVFQDQDAVVQCMKWCSIVLGVDALCDLDVAHGALNLTDN